MLWLPSDLRALVQEIDPDLQQTSGSRLPLEELQSNRIVKLNLHYSSMSAELIRSVRLLEADIGDGSQFHYSSCDRKKNSQCEQAGQDGNHNKNRSVFIYI